jgi:hypothetical protein
MLADFGTQPMREAPCRRREPKPMRQGHCRKYSQQLSVQDAHQIYETTCPRADACFLASPRRSCEHPRSREEHKGSLCRELCGHCESGVLRMNAPELSLPLQGAVWLLRGPSLQPHRHQQFTPEVSSTSDDALRGVLDFYLPVCPS